MFLHLGIKEENYTDMIVDYEIDDKTKNILETFFIESNNIYFDKSKINESIESIKRYNDKNEEYEYFSFDKEKK